MGELPSSVTAALTELASKGSANGGAQAKPKTVQEEAIAAKTEGNPKVEPATPVATPAAEKTEPAKPEEKKEPEAPKGKKKFWETPKKEGEAKKLENNNAPDELTTLKNQLSEREKKLQEYEAKYNSDKFKRYEELSEIDDFDDYFTKVYAKNPANKAPESLLKDAVTKGLKRALGEKTEITDDMIEAEIELVKSRGVMATNDIIDKEYNLQDEEYKKNKDAIIKTPNTAKAESVAKEWVSYVDSLKEGDEILGLPVAKDRLDAVRNVMNQLSKGEEKITGQDLFKMLYLKLYEGEIFDNIASTQWTEEQEKVIAHLKGSELRTGSRAANFTEENNQSKEEKDLDGLHTLIKAQADVVRNATR